MGSRKKRDDVQTLSVSDAALCQRCPRLLAYRGEGERGAWKVGIEGSGEKYGSLFHIRRPSTPSGGGRASASSCSPNKVTIRVRG